MLEKLIYTFKNDKEYEKGYFIYLKQNELNMRNPYDLVNWSRVEQDQEVKGDHSHANSKGNISLDKTDM